MNKYEREFKSCLHFYCLTIVKVTASVTDVFCIAQITSIVINNALLIDHRWFWQNASVTLAVTFTSALRNTDLPPSENTFKMNTELIGHHYRINHMHLDGFFLAVLLLLVKRIEQTFAFFKQLLLNLGNLLLMQLISN